MMYSNRLVATIKVAGKTLRENKDTVAVPFGSEYSIFIKNLNTVRALVKVSVDGTDATEDTWLIVPANGSIDLERYIRNGNFDRGNRFKFIERTSQIEEFRGVGAEDGLVRIEYKFEVPQPQYQWWNTSYTLYNNSTPTGPSFSKNTKGSPLRSRGISGQSRGLNASIRPQGMNLGTMYKSTVTNTSGSPLGDSIQCNLSQSLNINETSYADVNTSGITVAGSESDQKFVAGAWFPTEAESHVLVLKLVGAVAGQKVEKPITVKTKVQCASCGRKNKSSHKFCATCGTALIDYSKSNAAHVR